MISAPNLVVSFLETLDRLGIRYMVGGSFASSAWGQPRQTNDIDIALLLENRKVPEFHRAMKDDFMGSEDQIFEALQSSGEFRSFQLLHFEETFKIDCFVLNEDEYVAESFKRVRKYELSPGKSFPLASPEDMVLTKLRWFVLGNQISDRQWNDIVQVLEIQEGLLDEKYLNHWADFFRVRELLDRAKSQVVSSKP